MGLETGSFVADLVLTNPATTDLVSEGDDHLRLIKTTLLGTFPGFGGVFKRVDARSTGYTVLTTDNTKHFVVDASATTTVTLSLPVAASITAGFSILVTALSGATVLIGGAGAETIDGSATKTLGDRNAAFVYYAGSSLWRSHVVPTGQSGYVFHEGVAFSATVSVNSSPLHLNSGQLQFPAAQNASSNANTLDDYEEGTWTPVLTFDTPGNLSVTYALQTGTYTKKGREVTVHCSIGTSVFTHTTASGSLRVTGLPFTKSASHEFAGSLWRIEGVQVATTSQITVGMDAATQVLFRDNNIVTGGSDGVDQTEAVTTTNKSAYFTIVYHV